MTLRTLLALTSLLLPGLATAADLDLSPGDDLVTLIGGVAPGDTITLSGGEYSIEGRIDLVDLAGTESSPVVLRAAEGANPVIVVNAGAPAFFVRRSAWVRFSGIEVRGGDSGDPESPYNNSGIDIGEGSNNVPTTLPIWQ